MNEDERGAKALLPFFLAGGLFVLIHVLALLIAGPFEAAGVVVFENPNDPKNILFLFLAMLLTTIAILLIARLWKKQLVQILVLGATGLTAFYSFYPLLAIAVLDYWAIALSVMAAAILLIMLVRCPKWYIIDASGIVLGAGTTAMLGISLSIVLTVVLLLCLAVYDAVSVYKTKHMIDLADTVLDLRLPIMLVIPKTRKYSLMEETKGLKRKLKDQEERNAFFIGLGDFIMPGILVVSAFHNSANNGLLTAISVMVGTLCGFALLTASVIKGKPQAGLPYLCGGAIIGYLASYIVFGELVGLTFHFCKNQYGSFCVPLTMLERAKTLAF